MRYHTVVVGYDGSSNADLAVEAAADQVEPDGRVHVVTAFHPESDYQLVQHLQQLPEEFRYVYDRDTVAKERQYPAMALLEKLNVAYETHVVPDDPAAAIIDVAEREGADLVVVGSRGFGRVQRFLRGSVSARVAANAPMSVLIVHEPSVAATG